MQDESATLFHELLDDFLQAYKQEVRQERRTKKQLATYLDVNASVVSRWLQGIEYLPHVDQLPGIVQFLELSPLEAQRLYDAHTRSLLASRLQDPARLSPTARQDFTKAVKGLMDTASDAEPTRTDALPDTVDLGFLEDETVFYEEKILQKLTSVLQALLHGSPAFPMERPGTICMTRLGNDYGQRDYPELWKVWNETLIRLLEKGWTIEHLFRLSRVPQRSLTLVQNMMQYLKYGDYRPFAFRTYGRVPVPTELFIIPEQIGLLQLSTDDRGHANGGLLTQDRAQVRLFTQYFEMLKSQTVPLISTYDNSNEGRQRYLSLVERAEDTRGERYLQKNGLSYLTQPLMWFEPKSLWRQASNLSISEIARIAEHHRRCFTSFERQITEVRYRDACEFEKVRTQALEGIYHPYYDPHPQMQLPPMARLEHLQRTIWMLKNFKNFEIDLLDSDEVDETLHDSFWEVAGSRYVIMGLETVNRGYVNISIDEQMVAMAFLYHFNETWNTFSSKRSSSDTSDNRKARTIRWLEDLCTEVSALSG